MAQLTGRVVVVTGAGSGIGAEIAREAASRGAHVAALDLQFESIEHLAATSDGAIAAFACDVTDEEAIENALQGVAAHFDRIDGLVNAAGIVDTSPFLEFTYPQWERMWRVNTWGTYAMIKHVVPHMRASGGGSIVNFSSSGGKLSNPNTAPYAASKLAIISLTRSAAGELAPDIRVNSVVPGIVDTPMWEQLNREFAEIGAGITMDGRASVTPLRRPARPDDIAAAVMFLLSEDSRFVTGEDLNVSGGQVMF